MGTLADVFATVYRDYVTDGVPGSGAHNPEKPELRALGPVIETAIGTAGLGALVDVVKATRALLDADLAHDADTVGLVYADAADANNDLYIKTGASGAGAWTLTTTLHDIIGGIATPYVEDAAASAAAAAIDATNANADAASAATDASEATGSAVGALVSKNAAVAAADSAGAYLAAIETALDGEPTIEQLPLQAVTRAILAGFPIPVAGRQALLSEASRIGPFAYVTGDLSASVTLDLVSQGYLVAPAADPDGSSGAWRRLMNPSEPWRAENFGMPTVALNDGPAMRAIEALRPDGSTVTYPAGAFNFADIKLAKGGTFVGAGRWKTVVTHAGTNADGNPSDFLDGLGNLNTISDVFGVGVPDVRISDMGFKGLITADNANARFPVYVSPRSYETNTPGEMYDYTFERLAFTETTTGLRVMYGGVGPVDDRPNTDWLTPERVTVRDVYFACSYQDFIPEARNIVLERAFFARPDTVDNARPFAHCVRAHGFDRFTMRDCDLVIPPAAPSTFYPIGIMGAGVDNGLTNVNYRNGNDALIENVRMSDGRVIVFDQSGTTRFDKVHFARSITDDALDTCFQFGAKGTPPYFGAIEIQNSKIHGYNKPMFLTDAYFHALKIRDTEFVGNARAGGAFDGFGIKIEAFGTDQAGNPKKAPRLIEFTNVDFILNPSMMGFVIWLSGELAAWDETLIRIRGCLFPEAVGGTPPALIGMSGTGDPWVDFGDGPVRLSTIDIADLRYGLGDSRRAPAGFDADYRANVRPLEIIDNFPPTFP